MKKWGIYISALIIILLSVGFLFYSYINDCAHSKPEHFENNVGNDHSSEDEDV